MTPDRPDETSDADFSWIERIGHLLAQPDEGVVIYRTEDELSGSRLVLRLVDPTAVLQADYQRVYASLSMSGSLTAPTDTIQEMQYLIRLFGLPLEKTTARCDFQENRRKISFSRVTLEKIRAKLAQDFAHF